MHQTLFYIPKDVFGIPLFGYGILFWAVLVVTVAALLLRARKHGMDEDAWSYIPMCFLAEILIVVVAPNVSTPFGFPIRGYGVFLLLGISSAIGLLIYRAKKLWNIPPDTIFSLAIWCVVCGLAGARLFFITEYWETIQAGTVGQTLLNIVSISEGGLVVYGSIIGGAVGSIVFLIRSKLPIFATLDLLAPALLLGICFGRLGCLMNGCCFGGVTDVPWGIVFPQGAPAHLHQIEHEDVFVYGLKFRNGQTLHPEKPMKPTRLEPGKEEEGLRLYAKSKRSMLRISEVENGSEAEKSGLKPGMTVIGFGFVERDTQYVEIVNDIVGAYIFLNDVLHGPGGKMMVVTDSPEPCHTYTFMANSTEVLPVHPTQIYSSICAGIGCVVLLFISQFCKKDGQVAVMFLFWYPITRFTLEMIRTDEGSFMGTGLTVSQNVSIGVILLGTVLLVIIAQRPAKRAYQGRFSK